MNVFLLEFSFIFIHVRHFYFVSSFLNEKLAVLNSNFLYTFFNILFWLVVYYFLHIPPAHACYECSSRREEHRRDRFEDSLINLTQYDGLLQNDKALCHCLNNGE